MDLLESFDPFQDDHLDLDYNPHILTPRKRKSLDAEERRKARNREHAAISRKRQKDSYELMVQENALLRKRLESLENRVKNLEGRLK